MLLRLLIAPEGIEINPETKKWAVISEALNRTRRN